MSDWKVAKEQSRAYDASGNLIGWSHHKAWVVRYQGRRVAGYLKWERAIDHVMTCHRKFGF